MNGLILVLSLVLVALVATWLCLWLYREGYIGGFRRDLKRIVAAFGPTEEEGLEAKVSIRNTTTAILRGATTKQEDIRRSSWNNAPPSRKHLLRIVYAMVLMVCGLIIGGVAITLIIFRYFGSA